MTPLPEDLARIAELQPGLPKRNGRLILDPRLAVSLVGWIVTVMLAYGAFNARISVLETRQQENDRRLQRIEAKLDELLGRR